MNFFDTPLTFAASVAILGATILAGFVRPAEIGRVALWVMAVLLEMTMLTIWTTVPPLAARRWSNLELTIWILGEINWIVPCYVTCLALAIDALQLMAMFAVQRSSLERSRQLVTIAAWAVGAAALTWCWDIIESGMTITLVWRFGYATAYRLIFATVSAVSLRVMLPLRAKEGTRE